VPLQKCVFDAFSLPWPFLESNLPPPPPTTPERIDPDKGDREPPNTPTQEPSAYEIALENWTPSNRFPNDHARKTRNLLAIALSELMDINAINVRGQKVDPGWFWLPPLSNVGNPGAGVMIKVAPEEGPIPARVVAGLKALSRWERNGKTWRYANAESDYAAAYALLGPLEAAWLRAVSAEAERDLAMIAHAIQVQNLLVGKSNRMQSSLPTLEDLFAKVDDDTGEIDPRTSNPVKQALIRRQKALAARTELQEQLRQLAACVQNGNKVMGFDVDRLKRGWKADLPKQLRLTLRTRDGFSDNASEVLDRSSPSTLLDLVSRMEEALRILIPVVKDAFEPVHSRVGWRDTMRQTLSEALQLAIWPHGTTEAHVQELITRLSFEGIESVIHKVHQITLSPNEDAEPSSLASLCVIGLPRLNRIACDVVELTQFFTEVSKLISNQTRSADETSALDQRELLTMSLEW